MWHSWPWEAGWFLDQEGGYLGEPRGNKADTAGRWGSCRLSLSIRLDNSQFFYPHGLRRQHLLLLEQASRANSLGQGLEYGCVRPGNMEVQTKGKIKTELSMSRFLSSLGGASPGSGLSLGSGDWLHMEQGWSRPRDENQCWESSRPWRKNRKGLVRKEDKSGSNETAHGDSNRSKDKDTQRNKRPEGSGEPMRLWGPLQGQLTHFWWRGSRKADSAQRSGVPTPEMEFRKSPGWIGGQKLVSEPDKTKFK